MKRNNIIYWLIAIMLGLLAFWDRSDSFARIRPVLIVLSFLLSTAIIVKKTKSYPFGYLVVLYLWLGLSFFIADNKNFAMNQLTLGTLTMLTCFSFFALAQKKEIIPIGYLIFIIMITILANFAYNNFYLLVGGVDFTQERIGGEGLNANTLAYYLFYLTFIIYILGDIVKDRWSKYLKIVFFLIIPLSFYVAIITAARQVLIIQIPLMAILIMLRYSINYKRILVASAVIGIATLVIMPKVIDLYSNSYLAERNQKELKDDTRYMILKSSIEIGNEHFFTGVGLGNLQDKIGYIAHNSYLELYADTGIVGVLIYVFFTFGFVRRQYRRYKRTKDRMYLSFLVFGFFFIVDNFFYVFYTTYWLMSFYVLVVVHAETYHHDKCSLNYDNIVKIEK